MDFFDAQERAKRITWKLIALYLTAVILIVVSIYLIVFFLLGFSAYVPPGATGLAEYWEPGLFLVVSTLVIITILLGSFFRIAQLRKGGSAVAEMLGGRKVEPSSRDPKEQRLINIVEEMSIASGLPVPDIYILDREENINAFAAGFGTQDAAVGVTRGALDQLSRDEMQGVIAHEFSHIFNGDMRLNIRLIGILNGILLLHIMGMILMRSAMYSGMFRGGGGRGRQGGGNAAIAIILIGLGLLIVGYIGMLFGRMIQAAISRQREYLADAAAVQYTRNPDGLAGALRKIGQAKKGGKIQDGHAMEMSHLFFANSFHTALDRVFATHPPLKKRIEAISPALANGDERRRERIQKKFQTQHASASKKAPASALGTDAATTIIPGHPAITPEVILGAIGTLEASHVRNAGKLLEKIPAELREAAHEPLAAEALIYALLLSAERSKFDSRDKADSEEPGDLPEWFLSLTDHSMADETAALLRRLGSSDRNWYLPLTELALPTLRKMSENQYKQFRQVVEQAVLQGGADNLFAFALEKMVVRQLDSAFSHKKKPEIRHHHLKTLGKELSLLFSAFAHTSEKDSSAAWESGIRSVEQLLPEEVKLLAADQFTIRDLDSALDELAASANPVKKYFLTAVIHIITADREISTREKELVRAVSEALDSPIPLGALG